MPLAMLSSARRPHALLMLPLLLAPLDASAQAPPEEAADRCSPALLGVLGEIVAEPRVVDAAAYRSGMFPNRAKAVEAAREEARRHVTERLRAKVCGALVDKADCDAEMAQLLAPVERVFEDRYACVVMGVEANRLGKQTAAGRATQALQALGTALGASLREAGASGAVALDVVRTSAGCSAVGLEGARQTVASALARAGVAVLAPDAPASQAWSVALEVTKVGPQLQISARIEDPSDPSAQRSRAVGTLATFPQTAFGEVRLEKTCPANVKARSGAEGLTARLTLPTQVCAGENFSAQLEVSQPARVQVWSVAPDGSAILVVPGLDASGAPVDGTWEGKRPLPAGMATPNLSPGDEMLVAVALPASSPVAASAPSSFCRVPEFDAKRLPQGAAVAVQSWRVLDEPGRCPAAEAARQLLEQASAQMQHAPICP
jgi:hypothetical protein